MKNILNKNDFDLGYKNGFDDATNNIKKRYNGMVSIKSLIFGDFTMQTYINGYDLGYLDGLRNKNIVKTVNIPTEITKIQPNNNETNLTIKNNNMSIQKIEIQLDSLRQLQTYLVSFATDLKNHMSQYNDRVHALRESGLPDEVSVNYDQNYCIPTQQKIFQIISDLEKRDMPFVRDNITHFEQALELARRNYS